MSNIICILKDNCAYVINKYTDSSISLNIGHKSMLVATNALGIEDEFTVFLEQDELKQLITDLQSCVVEEKD